MNRFVKARAALEDVIKPTPLIYSRFFSEEYHNEIYLKPENLQVTGAFKIRGAYHKIHLLSDDQKKAGLVASSAGNHAQGVAYAAASLGVSATIVMPSNTPLIKVEATRDYGAEVVLFGECYDDAYQEARRLERIYGYSFLHPFDDEEIIEGQGTIALEILEELRDTDIILVPIGGGGLISGIASAAKQIKPEIQVIGVEPVGAMSMKYSLSEGSVTPFETINTIAEGVAVKNVGQRTYDYVARFVDEIITVSDTDIMEAFLLLLEKEKMIAENAGVLSLAALKKLKVQGKSVVSIISGGNIDVVTISELINRGLVVRNRILMFSVELPDTPGQLLCISRILSEHRANIIKLEHNQFKTVDRFKRVILEVTCETNGIHHVEEIRRAMEEAGYTLTILNNQLE